MGRLSELARQKAVLAACRATLNPSAPLDPTQACWASVAQARLLTDAACLRAYQANAQALAKRVLAHTYPTIGAMVGEQALDALAWLLWKKSPPQAGDLGEWGHALAELLAEHPDVAAWPWLADSARLDWARHMCARAADAVVDTDSLHRLGDSAPARVRIQLKPNVQVVCSPWPITALWEAHQLPSELRALAARQALDQAPAHGATVVWRHPWQVQMAYLTGPDAIWMSKLSTTSATSADDAAGQPLSALLDEMDADFDFSAWLATALTQGWLWRVTVASA